MPRAKSKLGRKYTWKRDLPDQRDLLYKVPTPWLGTLPLSVDMRAKCPPVYDQLDLGSCTANATGALDQFVMMKENPAKAFQPSRLFIYYGERVLEGSVGYDSGAQLRDGIKVLASLGAPPENLWPYSTKAFRTKPPKTAYDEAKKHPATAYSRIAQNQVTAQGCLASGYPFVFGFTVYESFESDVVATTGIVPMPQPHEQLLGGHAVMAAGYDTMKQMWLVRNSWGTGWGLEGYFWMPFNYLMAPNLASDLWTIRQVTE